MNISKKIFLVFVTILSLSKGSLASLGDNIPYEDNDSGYVLIPEEEYLENSKDWTLNVLDKVDIHTLSIPQCSDVPLLIEECRPAVCFETRPFGKLYREIEEKMKDGKCRYIERTPNYGGINCEFQEKNIVTIAGLFEKMYTQDSAGKNSLTEDEVDQLKSFLGRYCKSAKDAILRSPISIGPTSLTDIEIKNGDIGSEEEGVNIEKEETEKQVDAFKQKNKPNKFKAIVNKPAEPLKSIMFNKEEMEFLSQLLGTTTTTSKIYNEELKAENELNFYLNSIIFFNDERWVIWVNNNKFSNGGKLLDFEIVSVTPSAVVLSYNISNIDKTLPDWRKKLVASSDGSYHSNNGLINLNIVDGNDAIVTAEIKPNQRFNLNSMHIYEGGYN